MLYHAVVDIYRCEHAQIQRPWGRHKVNRRPKRVDVRSFLTLARGSTSSQGNVIIIMLVQTTYMLDVAHILFLLVHLAARPLSQLSTIYISLAISDSKWVVCLTYT
jgi:hypothetical protein